MSLYPRVFPCDSQPLLKKGNHSLDIWALHEFIMYKSIKCVPQKQQLQVFSSFPLIFSRVHMASRIEKVLFPVSSLLVRRLSPSNGLLERVGVRRCRFRRHRRHLSLLESGSDSRTSVVGCVTGRIRRRPERGARPIERRRVQRRRRWYARRRCPRHVGRQRWQRWRRHLRFSNRSGVVAEIVLQQWRLLLRVLLLRVVRRRWHILRQRWRRTIDPGGRCCRRNGCR